MRAVFLIAHMGFLKFPYHFFKKILLNITILCNFYGCNQEMVIIISRYLQFYNHEYHIHNTSFL